MYVCKLADNGISGFRRASLLGVGFRAFLSCGSWVVPMDKHR